MYGLLFGMTGLVLGTFAGIVIGARYVRAENLQAQIDETQARMLTMLGEMRSTLDETRNQVRSAWTSATGRSGAGGAEGPPGAAGGASAGDDVTPQPPDGGAVAGLAGPGLPSRP
jgi:hypothetical protein